MTEDPAEKLYCYRHPDRETLLRCNQCGRPICPECAVKVPTGYRCRECIHEQQKRFDTAESKDYLIGGSIAFMTALIGSFLIGMIPYLPGWISALLFGGLIGHLICEIVRRAVQKRRSGKLTLTVMIAAGIGALLPRLPEILLNLQFIGAGPVWLMNGLLQIFIHILFVIVLCGTIWAELNGMVFRS